MTPKAQDSKHAGPSAGELNRARPGLWYEAGTWPTPRSEDSESAGNHPGAQDSLTGVMREWQTPGTDSFRSRGGERKDEMGLDQQARSLPWATPSAHDAKGANGPAHQEKERPHEGQLANQVAWGVSLPAPATAMPGAESSESAPTSRRQLNPRFTEWLMGWTPGWTSLAPLGCGSPGTASYRSAPVSPSAPSGDNWPTPDTQNTRGGQAMRSEAKGKHAMSLHHVVEGWE